MKIDQANDLYCAQVFDPAVPSTTTAGNAGAVIDLQGYKSATILFNYGSWTTTGATFTVELQECPTSGGTYTAVADADLIGTEAGASVAAAATVDDDTCKKLGYIGSQRYIKPVVVANTATGVLGMTAVLGNGIKLPKSTQAASLTA